METIQTTPLGTEDNRAAFERSRDRRQALPLDALLVITVDCVAAAQRVLGCMPKLRTVPVPDGTPRPAALEEASLDDLGELAQALLWAQYELNCADAPAEPIDEMVAEATRARDVLVADATALAKRGVISTKVLDSLKGGVGYRNLVEDLMSLVAQLSDNESAVVAHSGLEAGELDRYRVLGSRLAAALGRRAEQPKVPGPEAETRQRAYTLLWDAYDEVRRVVTFLRWRDGDADELAPSLHAGKQHRASDAAQPADATRASTTPATAPTTPAAAGLPTASPFGGGTQ